MSLHFADSIMMTDITVHKGQGQGHDGRYLAISATLFKQHKMLFLVTYAPVMAEEANQAAFFTWVGNRVTTDVPDIASRTVMWFGDHNNVPNPALDEFPPPAKPSTKTPGRKQ